MTANHMDALSPKTNCSSFGCTHDRAVCHRYHSIFRSKKHSIIGTINHTVLNQNTTSALMHINSGTMRITSTYKPAITDMQFSTSQCYIAGHGYNGLIDQQRHSFIQNNVRRKNIISRDPNPFVLLQLRLQLCTIHRISQRTHLFIILLKTG